MMMNIKKQKEHKNVFIKRNLKGATKLQPPQLF